MNRSNWEHVGYGIAVTALFAVAGAPFTGAVAAIAFFYGRESRDAQILDGVSDLAMLNPKYWTRDGRRDFFPVVAATLLFASVVALT